MTYEMIIAQVASNMDWQGYEGKLIKNIKFAIQWAESQLAAQSNSTKETFAFPVNLNQSTYLLPEDVEYPRGVFLSNNNGDTDLLEVQYEEMLKFITSPNDDTRAQFSGKTLYAIRKTQGGMDITFFPALQGRIVFTYDALIREDLDIDHTKSPQIHRRFHANIIDGATYWLANQEMAKIISKGDPVMLQAYSAIVQSRFATFKEAKEKYAEFSNHKPEVPIVQPYNYYDKPESSI